MDLKNMDLKNMDYNEKLELAENPSTPIDVLRELAKDEYWLIRRKVATHPNTSLDLLRDLVKDENSGVRVDVAQHPKASSKLLVILFEYEKSLRKPDENVIWFLYAHKNLPAFAKRVIETLFGEMVA